MNHRKLNFADHQKSDFRFPVCVLTDNITLKENIGSLFRLCDALAVEHLYLSQAEDVLSGSKISRVARNTDRHVPHTVVQNPVAAIEQLKHDGYTIIALELTTHSIKIQDFDFGAADKVCLILGSETQGVSDDLLESSDYCVHIAMHGINSSMNVISAAAIALFEITRDMS